MPETFGDMLRKGGKCEMRRPVIHGLLRQGETMNLIASSKIGKSWLATDLAIAVATGRSWLGRFTTDPGNVLVLDNELHRETILHRVPQVAEAREIPAGAFAERLWCHNLRGKGMTVNDLPDYLARFPSGHFRMVVLDALYKFLPEGTDENDNGAMAKVYGTIDALSELSGAAFALVHHSSKGNQSAKAVTDVGSGAGAQSRATDTHLVFRPHAEDDCVVLEAAVRSWAPLKPICLRWRFPLLHIDDELSPDLRRDARRAKVHEKPAKPAKPQWTVDTFVGQFVTESPTAKAVIVCRAQDAGVPANRISPLIAAALADGKAHLCAGANGKGKYLSTKAVAPVSKAKRSKNKNTHAPPTPPTGA